MKYIYILIVSFLLSACSGEQITHGITKTQIVMSGNKPPASFEIANVNTMRDYVFNTKDFSFSLPFAKQSDFTQMGGWDGMSMRDGKTIALGFKDSIVYHISISTSGKINNYTHKEKALENGTRKFRPKRIIKKTGKTSVVNINTHIEHHAKENYACIISSSEVQYKNYGTKYRTGYNCYKFNTSRTKAKNVVITLTYNKPQNPLLAKQYTYQDLKNRAKRTLDSLYIKDGW